MYLLLSKHIRLLFCYFITLNFRPSRFHVVYHSSNDIDILTTPFVIPLHLLSRHFTSETNKLVYRQPRLSFFQFTFFIFFRIIFAIYWIITSIKIFFFLVQICVNIFCFYFIYIIYISFLFFIFFIFYILVIVKLGPCLAVLSLRVVRHIPVKKPVSGIQQTGIRKYLSC